MNKIILMQCKVVFEPRCCVSFMQRQRMCFFEELLVVVVVLVFMRELSDLFSAAKCHGINH